MNASVVMMGVAGCGKSSLAAVVANREQMQLVEGDDWHSAENRTKMRQGIALTDADREGWLNDLAQLLKNQPTGLALTCSALRRNYRERLRQACPDLRFVFLDIAYGDALERVKSRTAHYFSAHLVDSQFATLESPLGEPRVLRVDALKPLPELETQVSEWLHATAADTSA